ncbi:MAG: Crp/Fnr family transcriptional regulator [Dysgonamonadaceae bacterium]
MEQTSFIIQRIIDRVNQILGQKTGLSENAFLEFASIFERRELKRGELFCKEGQVARYMSYVESGLIRQYYYKKQKDVTEHFTPDGEMFFCIESFFTQQPSKLVVEALEPSVIQMFSFEKIENLARRNPEIGILYNNFLKTSLIISQRKADSIRYETAHERYDRLLREQPKVVLRAPLQYIASYLLMTPESLSRIRGGQL